LKKRPIRRDEFIGSPQADGAAKLAIERHGAGKPFAEEYPHEHAVALDFCVDALDRCGVFIPLTDVVDLLLSTRAKELARDVERLREFVALRRSSFGDLSR
jgi:hypothetical protein